MGRGDAETAAEFHDSRASPQQAADHPGLCALVYPPEHLRPHLRREVAAPDVEPEPVVSYAAPRQGAYKLTRRVACHDPGHPELQRGGAAGSPHLPSLPFAICLVTPSLPASNRSKRRDRKVPDLV